MFDQFSQLLASWKAQLLALYAANKGKIDLSILVTVFLFGMFVHAKAFAYDASVTWVHPTAREDGTPMTVSEILETQIDHGLCAAGGTFPATPTGTTRVAAPASGATITNLPAGSWCFRARTLDTGNRISVNSSVVAKVILAPPRPPSLNSTITVAFDLNGRTWQGTVRLGRAVGTIDLGTPCLAGAIKTNKGVRYRVNPVDVKYTRTPRSTRIVTKCDWS